MLRLFKLVPKMRGCSSIRVNKLRYIDTIRGTLRDIIIKEQKIYYIKIKTIPCILEETIPLLIDKFQPKKGASVLE